MHVTPSNVERSMIRAYHAIRRGEGRQFLFEDDAAVKSTDHGPGGS
jgi:hypothetical protein